MTICFNQIAKTAVFAVTTEAASWTDPGQPSTTSGFGPAWRGRYIVSSDTTIHIDPNDTASPETSARVPANTPVEIEMTLGQSLSYVLGTGAASGSIWITKKA